MQKERVIRDDGRYVLLYTFEQSTSQEGGGCYKCQRDAKTVSSSIEGMQQQPSAEPSSSK